MCIIVAKPKNIKMPDMAILEQCFINNPDGAGMMFNHNNLVYGYKGFMTFQEFKDALVELQKQFGNFDEKGVVMHFRIATHGGTCPQNTHPFPLNGGYRAMRKRRWVAPQGFAHNGIINSTSGHVDVQKFRVSDSMVFGKIFALPVAQWTNIAEDKMAVELLGRIAESKLAFMNGQGHISTCGDFNENDGVLYSNYTWLTYDTNPYDVQSTTYNKANRVNKGTRTLRRVDNKCIVYGEGKSYDGKYADATDAFCAEDGNVYTYSPSLRRWVVKYPDVDFLYDIDHARVAFVSQRFSDELESIMCDEDKIKAVLGSYAKKKFRCS